MVERGRLTYRKKQVVLVSVTEMYRKVDRMYRNTLKKEDGAIVRTLSMKAKGDDCDKVGESEVANSAANEARKSVESCKMFQTRVRLKTNGIAGGRGAKGWKKRRINL